MEGAALPTIKVEEIKKEDCDHDVKRFDDGGVFSVLSSDCKVETDSTARPVSHISVSSGDVLNMKVKVVKEEKYESVIQSASTMHIKCEVEETPLQASNVKTEDGGHVKTEDGGHVKTEEYLEEGADNPLNDEVGDNAIDKNHKYGTKALSPLTQEKTADMLRAAARERMRRLRQKETAEAAEKRRAKDRARMRRWRQEMSAEAAEKRRAAERARKRRRTQEMSAEAAEKRRAAERAQKRRRRQEMSAEAAEKRRAAERARKRRRRQAMSAEDLERRRAAERARKHSWRHDSSPDTRNKRRTMERDKTRQRRMTQTPEQADAHRLKEKKRSQDRRDKALLHRNKKNLNFSVDDCAPSGLR